MSNGFLEGFQSILGTTNSGTDEFSDMPNDFSQPPKPVVETAEPEPESQFLKGWKARTSGPMAEGLMRDDFGLVDMRDDGMDRGIRIAEPTDRFGPPTEAGEDSLDLMLQLAQGTVIGSRMIVDAFGADSDVSKQFRDVEGYLDAMMSAGARKDNQEIASLAERAKSEGVLDQLITGFEMLKVKPVGTVVQAIGTSVPVIAGTVLATLTGGPVAGLGVGLSLGATQGSGIVKGAIYDTVKQELLKIGMPEQEAESRAVRAQEWGGENTDQILTGAGITALGAITGLESAAVNALIRKFSQDVAKKTSVQAGTNIVLEGITEGAQGAQEQLAKNIATQRQGDALGNQELSDTPTMGGVVSQGVMEAGAGMGTSATTAPLTMSSQEEQTPDPVTTSSPNYGTVEIKSPKGGNLTVSTISAEETESLASEPMMARRYDKDENDEESPESPLIYSRISRLADNQKFISQLPPEGTADDYGKQLLRFANRGAIDKEELADSEIMKFLNAWHRDFSWDKNFGPEGRKITQERFVEELRKSTPQKSLVFIVDEQQSESGKGAIKSYADYDEHNFNPDLAKARWQESIETKLNPIMGASKTQSVPQILQSGYPTSSQFKQLMSWVTNELVDLHKMSSVQRTVMAEIAGDLSVGTGTYLSSEMQVEMLDHAKRLLGYLRIFEDITDDSREHADIFREWVSQNEIMPPQMQEDSFRIMRQNGWKNAELGVLQAHFFSRAGSSLKQFVESTNNYAIGFQNQFTNDNAESVDFVRSTEAYEYGGGDPANYIGLAIAPRVGNDLQLMQGGQPEYSYHGSFSDANQRVFTRLTDMQDDATGERLLHIEELQSDLLNNDLGVKGENPIGLPSENVEMMAQAEEQTGEASAGFMRTATRYIQQLHRFFPASIIDDFNPRGGSYTENNGELLYYPSFGGFINALESGELELPADEEFRQMDRMSPTGISDMSRKAGRYIDSFPQNQELIEKSFGLNTYDVARRGSGIHQLEVSPVGIRLLHADALFDHAKKSKTVSDLIEYWNGESGAQIPKIDYQEVDGEVTLTVDLNRLVGEEDNPQNVGQIIFTPSDEVGVRQLPVTIKQFGETYVIPSADIGSRWFNSLLGAIDEARAMQKMLNWLSDVDFNKKSGVGSDPKHRITYSRDVKNSYIQFLNGYALDFVRRFTNLSILLGPMPVNEINEELVGPERADLPEITFMRPLTSRQEMALGGLDLYSDQMVGLLFGEDVPLTDEQKITQQLARQKAKDPSTEAIRKMWSGDSGQQPDDYNYREFLNFKFKDQVVVKNEDSQFVPNRNRLYTQMLKRTIAYAVQNGYDGISVSSPQSHVKRWGREYQVLYNDIYGKRIPNTLKKLTGLPLKSVQLNATVDGTPNKTVDNIGERVAIKFTPEATARIRNEGFQFARQGETPAVAVSTEQAVQAAQDLAKRLNVSDDIRISISEGELAEGVKGAVLGDGHIIVSAQAHASIDDIKQTILHEMVGHYGIRRILSQSDLGTLLTRINLEAQRSPEFKTQIEEVRKRGYDEGDPMVFVEEVLAMMAETEMSQFAQLKNDIVAIFTKLMRALGINTSAITKAEVLQLLGQSKRALQAKPESDSVVGQGGVIEPVGERNMPDNEPAFESRRREGDRAGYFDMTKENVDANIRDADAPQYYGADQTKGYFVRMPIEDFIALTTSDDYMTESLLDDYSQDGVMNMSNIERLQEEGASTSSIDSTERRRFNPAEVDRPNLDATPFLILSNDEDELGNPIVKVTGHEGRHRAALAFAEGATTMPVFIRYEDKLIFDFEKNKARGGEQDFEDLTASREVVGQFDESRRAILPKGVEATYFSRERAYDIMTSQAEEAELGLEPAFFRQDEAGPVSASRYDVDTLVNQDVPESVSNKADFVSFIDGLQERPRDLEADRDAIAEDLARETEVALNKSGNAAEWYRETIAGAMAVAAKVFPEIGTDSDAKAAFQFALAITSNGAGVDENTINAVSQYRSFRRTGKFPEKGWGKETEAMVNSFRVFNRLIDTYGLTELNRLMNMEWTAGDLKELGFSVSGELADAPMYFSAIFGPKIGQGFYQNLGGNWTPLTMDRWFMRTIGRVTGRLSMYDNQKHVGYVDAARKATEESGSGIELAISRYNKNATEKITIDDFMNDFDVATDVLMAGYRAWSQSSFDKSMDLPVMRTGRSLSKLFDTRDAPSTGTERAQIRALMNEVQKKLADKGLDLDMASIQALLWFPEKDLYLHFGVTSKKATPTDYEQEMIKVARKKGISKKEIDDGLRNKTQSPDGESDGSADRQDRREGRSDAELRDAVRTDQYVRRLAQEIGRGDGAFRGGSRKANTLTLPTGRQKIDGTSYKVGTGWKRTLLSKLQSAAGAPTEYVELAPSRENAQLFTDLITRAAQSHGDRGKQVYIYDVEEIEQAKLFITPDGTGGFAVKPDGDIVSVFATAGGPYKHLSYTALALAVQAGGVKLDAFAPILPRLYQVMGFSTAARVAFDPNEKPDGWNTETMGEPDVHFMVFDPAGVVQDKAEKVAYGKALTMQNLAKTKAKKAKSNIKD